MQPDSDLSASMLALTLTLLVLRLERGIGLIKNQLHKRNGKRKIGKRKKKKVEGRKGKKGGGMMEVTEKRMTRIGWSLRRRV